MPASKDTAGKTKSGQNTYNLPAKDVPFYTPAQDPPAGTYTGPAGQAPTLFTPLTIRGVTFANRFVVSPMCTYSADYGHLSDWHLVHLGQFASRGAALTIVEATAVLPNGRISPEDSGLWQDSQIAPLRRIADYVHSQNQTIGIQLGHAGRKASTYAPWLREGGTKAKEAIDAAGGGWPDNVWGPSALAFDKGYADPTAITVEQIQEVVAAFAAAAKRTVAAGIDVIELHGAHGYLISEFLSPLSNRRTDQYGGSLANRARLLREVTAAVRGAIPDTMPLFLRLSATEWRESGSEPSWTLEDTIALAKTLPDLGIDLLDVSSGGNSHDQEIPISQYFQADLAWKVREALASDPVGKKLLIGTVGFIQTGELAREVSEKGGYKGSEHPVQADLVLVGRQFLREPELVLKSAHDLDVSIQWPHQYHRAPFRSKH